MLKYEYLKSIAVTVILFCGCNAGSEEKSMVPNEQAATWPPEVSEVSVISSLDGAGQKAMFWTPPADEPRPLLVALHTWSGDHRQPESINYWQDCRERGWVFMHPDFRGPNVQPLACGSEAAVQDVLDAVEYAKAHAMVDTSRIYLVGCSGGGYLTLLMAGRHPEVWAAASAWVPISDLAAWHAQCSGTDNPQRGYAENMEAVCGGAPGASSAVDSSYAQRSALTWLHRAAGLKLEINAGIHDGHTGSVPVSHSLRAFNCLAAANGRPELALTDPQIEWITTRESLPEELNGQADNDSLYGERGVLFRRQAGPARVTLFEGGHEIIYRAALAWLDSQGSKY